MCKILSESQTKLRDTIIQYINNKVLPPEFSYSIENEEILFDSTYLRYPSNKFEKDMQVLVDFGYFLQIDEKIFIYSGKKQ